VHHEVVGDRRFGTLQLGQPAWVAEATGPLVLPQPAATAPTRLTVQTAEVSAGGRPVA